MVVVPLLIIFAGLAVYLMRDRSPQTTAESPTTNDSSATDTTKSTASTSTSSSDWTFTGNDWQSSGNPPECANPLSLKSPVDVTKATAILYPGQTRGGNYKTHGGFRLAETTNSASVKIPLAANLVKASRYIEQGELQYFFVFINECGLMYRLDHLQTLTAKFQAIAEALPPAKVDDSRTTNISPPVSVVAGEEIATAVGFIKTQNSSFDFGVNDLRQKNGVTPNPAWADAFAQDKEYAPYGICWFDLLPDADAAIVKTLPAGDGQSGKTSDYCK